MAKLKAVEQGNIKNGFALTSTNNAWLDIDQALVKTYVKDLDEKRTKQEQIVKNLRARLANKNYVENAPAAVVEQTRSQLEEAEKLLESIALEQKKFKL